MIKNAELEALCQELCEYPPRWDEIVSRFKAHPNFNPDNRFIPQQYTGWFGEIHLDISLEEIAEAHPELCVSLNNDIQQGSETKAFRFHYTLAGRLHAYKKSNNAAFAEYDKVILVKGLPSVFEVKMSKWNKQKTRKANDGIHEKRVGSGINIRLNPEFIKKKLRPIKSFYKEDVGYVFVIPRDMYYRRVSDDSSYRFHNFREKNGIFVPLYTDRLEFSSQAREAASFNGLKMKEPAYAIS